jgi:hypothetical protein
VTEQDRVATHAYLQARYAYDKAQLATYKASTAEVEALGHRLADECPQVLAQAPRPDEPLVASLSGHPLSPLARGVADRQTRQLADLSEELALAESQAALGLLRSAATTFAYTVRRLQWSNHELTAYEHTQAEAIEWTLGAAPPNVCADMRSWVSSGYLSLSPAARQIESEQAPIHERIDLVFFDPDPHISMSSFEGTDDRALARRVARLQTAMKPFAEAARTVSARIEGRLGLISARRVEETEGIPEGSVLIAKGKAPPDRSYKVWVEPKRAQLRTSCVRLYIEEAVRTHGGAISSSSEECVSRSHPQALRAECTPPDEITLSAQMPDRVRRVIVTLSDGRQLSTPVAHVPARLGGPFGFYYMELRARKPMPVSLREFGADGRLLRTVMLHVTGDCHQPAPSTKHFVQVPRELAVGRAPGGPTFVLVGERSGRSATVEIQLRVAHPIQLPFIVGSFEEPDEITAPQRGNGSKPYAWSLAPGCQPHPYAILFGLLRDPADVVQARTAQGLLTLQHVSLPAALHATGALAYVALAETPTEIIVSGPSGKTLRDESLARVSREAQELCEGEAEPPV